MASITSAAWTFRLALLAAIIVASGNGGHTHAEVIGYTVKTVGADTVLTAVVVDRGTGPVAYDPARLIGARITHFKSSSNRNVVVSADAPAPDGPRRLGLLADLKLTTGVINPGGAARPLVSDPVLDGPEATEGMAVAFDPPVVNGPGDDLVVFEIQRGDSPPEGDAFHLSPLRFGPPLRSITVSSFDVTFADPGSLPVAGFRPYISGRKAAGVADLRDTPLTGAESAGDFKALAVGIDLSSLGYKEGAAVAGLFLQDAGTSGAKVDPMLVAGLPPAEAPNLLAEVPDLPKRRAAGELLQEFIEGPMSDVEEIVFAERVPGNDHWYANFGHYWCGRQEYPEQQLPDDWQPEPIFKTGGRLVKLNLPSGRLTVLVDDPAGGVRDPHVHYDGRKILFSYRPGGETCYHLYEIGCDGANLVQLTDGDCDDIEPVYLPSGDIIFCSSRCNRVVNCWRTPVATLYRCKADGSNVRVVSTNIEHDNTPWVLPDGRVLYMRWEYVDRSQLSFHHLWTINPDGTGQMVYYGNQHPGTDNLDTEAYSIPGKHPGIVMIDAKPIPGTKRVVASFSPRHGKPEHMGVVTIVDPSTGPDDQAAAVPVSPAGKLYRDPYPISDDCFLVADAKGILVMDGQGNTEVVYAASHSELQCHEPRPLRCRARERVVPERTDLAEPTGRLVLSDVYRGRNMAGVDRGEIKKLLVLEQLPKPVNFSGGPWPLSIEGTFSLSRVLGTVPVEADGSAAFDVPALRPVFFVALDENDLSVKRMQSFVTIQPGETTGCVGCHEQRGQSPHGQVSLMAMDRRPSRIAPIAGVPNVLDFPRDVQPILDRHCVGCHNPDEYQGRIDLCGDHTPLFSQSYWTLIQKVLVVDGRNEPYGNRSPREIGSSASRLMKLIDGSHYDARLSPTERDTVRLWIDTSAAYPGTYAALGSGMHPVEFPVEVMGTRCGECHGTEPNTKPAIGRGLYFTFGPAGPPLPLVHDFADLKLIRGAMGYFKYGRGRTPQSLANITRPEKSLLLRAPLSKSADGLGLCDPEVFADTADPDYVAILASISAAAERHRREKRFDMPDFRPNDHYVIQMQRAGVLPEGLARDAPVDCYITDHAYWQSFQYNPTATH